MTELLEGVRVLDLTTVLAGPFAAYQLSLMGADVIKVEIPDTGDLARDFGESEALKNLGMGPSFLAQNSGKRSVTVNLKRPGGTQVFERLLASADVLVENMRPGVLSRLGFSWDVNGDASMKVFGSYADYFIPLSTDANIRGAGAALECNSAPAIAPSERIEVWFVEQILHRQIAHAPLARHVRRGEQVLRDDVGFVVGGILHADPVAADRRDEGQRPLDHLRDEIAERLDGNEVLSDRIDTRYGNLRALFGAIDTGDSKLGFGSI